jgi:hypothetical protein
MLILLLWGRRLREKHLGYVADYCRVCRKILAFEVIEQRMANHIWFIPIERGRIVRNAEICSGCQTDCDCYLGRFKSVSRSARGPLDSLIERTQPNVREANKERLAVAELLTTGSDGIDAKARLHLMMEAFSLAEPHFRIGYGHQGRHILAVALRPLWPNVEEIRACLERYRSSGSRMGAHLRVEEVMVSIYPESEVKDPNRFSY